MPKGHGVFLVPDMAPWPRLRCCLDVAEQTEHSHESHRRSLYKQATIALFIGVLEASHTCQDDASQSYTTSSPTRLEHNHEIRPLEQINGFVIHQDCPNAVPAAHGNNFFTYSQLYDFG